jgi:hypothetical protein
MLVAVPDPPGFVSLWFAAAMQSESQAFIDRELSLELARRRSFPDRISRLRGMFCFLDLRSAEQACSWSGRHFRPEYLAELSLAEAGPRRDRLDGNLITHAPLYESGRYLSSDWMQRYWAGDAHPKFEPLWETLVEGRMIVLGTALREHAYRLIKDWFPESLGFLEIARLAAWIGSDLGNIAAYIMDAGDDLELRFLMDMRDAEDPAFLGGLRDLIQSGHPVNRADMNPHFERDSFGAVPDLRRAGFRRPKAALPFFMSFPSSLNRGNAVPVSAGFAPLWTARYRA